MTISIRTAEEEADRIPSRFSTVAWSVFQLIFAVFAYDWLRALHLGKSSSFVFALVLGALLVWIEVSGVARRKSFRVFVYSNRLVSESAESTAPPRQATFFLLLLPKRNREHLIGDLEEEFRTVVLPQYGRRVAIVWYWWQVTLIIGSPVWARFKHTLALLLIWKNLR